MMQISARFPQNFARSEQHLARTLKLYRGDSVESRIEERSDRIGSARGTPLTAHPNLVEAQEHMPARSRLPKIQLRTETRKQQDLVNLLLHCG